MASNPARDVLEQVVQLYCRTDEGRLLVAQSDHKPYMPEGHDVAVEGVRLDIVAPYGEKRDDHVHLK